MNDDLLDRFADWAGVVPEWWDLDGVKHVTPPETKQALIAAMGFDLDPGALRERLVAETAADADRALPREYVLADGRETRLRLDGDAATAWTLTLEDGRTLDGQTVDGALDLPPLPMGYHKLAVGGGTTLLLAAPERAPSPEDIGRRERMWGVNAALYGLRSTRNAGLGDYADLAALADGLGRSGADFLGLNPVHALGWSADVVSPYSPSHRQFLDARHIALDRVPDLEASPAAQRLLESGAGALAALRSATLIDYAAVRTRADPILRALFEAFDALDDTHPRKRAFATFRSERGPALERLCRFEALAERHGPNWAVWPDALRTPNGPAVETDAPPRAVAFHAYLQWLADDQLAAAQRAAQASGMALGLYADLAVGVRPDGAEPWAETDAFARGVSLGVPPDYFNANGQVWGLAPFNPPALRDADFGPFIQTIRAVARHAGMFRIDHVVGLQRCFWAPADGSPGGYVAQSLETLLAIVRIEAWRAGCVVVGEELGVVPDDLRARMRDRGIFGCAVMQFERSPDGEFRHPAQFAEMTLASFGTHDTPTAAGYWTGGDIGERRRIGQIDDAGAAARQAGRAADRDRLRRMTGHAAPEDDEDTAVGDILTGLHRALAHRGSRLAGVQLDDVAAQRAQPNMPGTTSEYPNWRTRSAVAVEDWPNHPTLDAVASLLGRRENQD
ncbi:MAG: 4-alpha-glucanotransferase [Pseudomonadota bacterium]